MNRAEMVVQQLDGATLPRTGQAPSLSVDSSLGRRSDFRDRGYRCPVCSSERQGQSVPEPWNRTHRHAQVRSCAGCGTVWTPHIPRWRALLGAIWLGLLLPMILGLFWTAQRRASFAATTSTMPPLERAFLLVLAAVTAYGCWRKLEILRGRRGHFAVLRVGWDDRRF